MIQVTHRKKGKREEVIRHALPEEKLQEIFGAAGWKQLPDEVYKRARVQPAVYTVEEHHVAVYVGKDNQTIVKADHLREFLKGFTSVVVCDGYSAYWKLDRETEAIVFVGD